MDPEQTIVSVLVAVTTMLTSIWALARIIIPRTVDHKIEVDQYERARQAFREDAIYEMLGEMINKNQKRADDLAESITEVVSSITEITQAIVHLTVRIDRNTDMIRILSQQFTVANDNLKDLTNKGKYE
jgi:chromosome segregation ATPase